MSSHGSYELLQFSTPSARMKAERGCCVTDAEGERDYCIIDIQ